MPSVNRLLYDDCDHKTFRDQISATFHDLLATCTPCMRWTLGLKCKVSLSSVNSDGVLQVIVIVNSEVIDCYTKAKRRAPAH